MSKLIYFYLYIFIQPYVHARTDFGDFYEVSDLIDEINRKQKFFHAGRNNFDELSTGLEDPSKSAIEVEIYKGPPISRTKIPRHFDAREKWPKCRTLREIPSQGRCANCWAINAAAAISDMLCIRSGQKVNIQQSAEDLTTCCDTNCLTSNNNGCRSGFVQGALRYWLLRGTVTGGHYGTYTGCKPYSDTLHRFNKRTQKRLRCVRECTNSYYDKPYEKDRRPGKELGATMVKFRAKALKQFQRAIMTSGPILATFRVYDDFRAYRHGVYVPYTESTAESVWHITCLIGWGTEDGVDYWLARNSWGADWAELGGYFKIRRGHNDRMIESYVFTIEFSGHRAAMNNTIDSSSSVFTLPNFVIIILGLFVIIVLQ